MKIKLIFCCLIFFICSCAMFSKEPNYECNFFPEESVPPSWIDGTEDLLSTQFYSAAGFAGRQFGGPEVQMKKAEINALDTLARTIQVSIMNKITAYTSVENGILVNEQINSLAKHFTEVFFKDAVIDDKWLDIESCLFWVQAKVPKKSVKKMYDEQLKQFKSLNQYQKDLANIKTSIDPLDSEEKKLDSLKTARNGLDEVDFVLLLASGLIDRDYDSYLQESIKLESVLKARIAAREHKKKLEQAEKFYKDSQEEALSNKQKMDLIEQAFNQLDKVDFSIFKRAELDYPDKVDYLIKYNIQKHKIILSEAENNYLLSKQQDSSDEKRMEYIKLAISQLDDINFQLLDLNKSTFLEKYKIQKTRIAARVQKKDSIKLKNIMKNINLIIFLKKLK